jgi:hypothetical protein
MMSDSWFGKPAYEIEQFWLDRAELEANVIIVEHERTMLKTNGDTEIVITERLIPKEGVTLSNYALGTEYVTWLGCKIGGTLIPNFQVLWLTDALTQENVIPTRYIVRTTSYGFLYIVASISVGVVLFQRREVS